MIRIQSMPFQLIGRNGKAEKNNSYLLISMQLCIFRKKIHYHLPHFPPKKKKTQKNKQKLLPLKNLKLKQKLRKDQHLEHQTATLMGWSQCITGRDISQLSKYLIKS